MVDQRTSSRTFCLSGSKMVAVIRTVVVALVSIPGWASTLLTLTAVGTTGGMLPGGGVTQEMVTPPLPVPPPPWVWAAPVSPPQ